MQQFPPPPFPLETVPQKIKGINIRKKWMATNSPVDLITPIVNSINTAICRSGKERESHNYFSCILILNFCCILFDYIIMVKFADWKAEA